MSQDHYSFRRHFESLQLGALTPNQAFGLYGLALYLNEMDIAGLATEALTDAPDDKAIDFCLIDRESGNAYCGQAYLSNRWNRPAAPSSKASYLSSGVTWLLQTPIEQVPERMQPSALELRDAISEGDVARLHILFVHNCGESQNVTMELDTVAHTAAALLDNNKIAVASKELGLESLERLYQSLDREILVEDSIDITIDGANEETSGRWNALVTTVSGSRLHELYTLYGDDLFSANIRGFLGIYRRRGNVNNKIRDTVVSEPEQFWAFNNGITVLVNDFVRHDKVLTVGGLSIINGAQTTGVIGDCDRSDAENVRVPCRFIKCRDEAVIRKIIQSNNTQNAFKAFDLRSTDDVQRELAAAFRRYGIEYVHRRNASSVGRLPVGAIQAESVAQTLCSLQGEFQTAIRQRSLIFEDDVRYNQVFPRTISAEHVYLAQCLADALDAVKHDLRTRAEGNDVTGLEEQREKLFGYSTAKQFVTAVMGEIAPQILGQHLPDVKNWRCRSNLVSADRSDIVDVWVDVIKRLLPKLVRFIGEEPQKAVRSTESVRHVSKELADWVETFGDDFEPVFAPLREISSITSGEAVG